MCRRQVLVGAMCWLVLAVPNGALAQGVGPSLTVGEKPDELTEMDVRLGLGAGVTDEEETASDVAGSLGLGLTYRPLARMLVDARFGWADYSQTYLSANRRPDGGRAVQVDESRWDAALAFGYDVIPPTALEGQLSLMPEVGLRMFWLDNEAFGTWSGAPLVGLRAGFEATEQLSAQAGVDFGYVLFGVEGVPSVMGDTQAVWSYDAGVALNFGQRYRLRLSYVGETLTFERTLRISNGAAMALEIQTL